MLRPSATLAALALLATGTSCASSWGTPSHHDALRDHYTHLLSPRVPQLMSQGLGHNVWEPMFPLKEKAKPDTTTRSVELEFIRNHGMQGEHLAMMYIGTPPQPVSLQLYFSGTELMVFNHKLEGHDFYDHSKSSTYKANGTWFHYGDLITGYTSRDVITIGDPETKHTIQARDTLFFELNGKDEILQRMAGDGAVSLGPCTGEGGTGAKSIVRTMIEHKELDEPVVGVFVDEHHADVLFGGIDSMHLAGPISYFPVTKELSTWSVPVTGVTVGNVKVKASPVGLFSATNFIAGPEEAVDAIAKAVGAENNVLACDAHSPNITFAIGDNLAVTLTKDDYALKTDQDNVCLFPMLGLKKLDRWILGNQFLQKVYLVLDFGDSEDKSRTGIALSRPSPFA